MISLSRAIRAAGIRCLPAQSRLSSIINQLEGRSTCFRYLSSSSSSPSSPSINGIMPYGSEPSNGTAERQQQDQVWRHSVNRIMEVPVGQWTTGDFNGAVQALRYWIHQPGLAADDMRWSILDRLVLEQHQQTKLQQPATGSMEVSSVIMAWVEHYSPGSFRPARTVMETLFRYQDVFPQAEIDVRTFTMVLDIAIQQGNDAAALASTMLQRIQNGTWTSHHLSARPDMVLFNAIILAHVGEPEGPQRAESVLELMKNLNSEYGMDTAPTDKTYLCLMNVWANSRQVTAPEIVERYLRHFMVNPDATAFSIVMNAWAKSSDPNACERCFSIFQHMNLLHKQGRLPAEPNKYIYGCVIQAFGRRGRAREAESVLRLLLDRYEATNQDPGLCPSNIVFNTLLDAWAKSNDRNGPQRAEALLETMQRLAVSTGNSSIAPDTIGFACVINAWSRDPTNGAPRAEAILNRMKELHRAGNPNVKPNAPTYATVLNCWAKSKAKGAAERADSMLKELNALYTETGEVEYKPNHYTYTCVLDAWARSGNPQAPERVEVLLDEMEKGGLVLASHQYTTAIIAWARSGKPESIERAEALVRRMKERSEILVQPELAPNVKTFNALLDVYGRNKRAQKAQETLDRMISGYRDGKEDWKPDNISINTVISAWSNSGDHQAGTKAEACFKRMEGYGNELHFKPDAWTFSSLISAFAKSRELNAAFRAQYYMDDMKSRYEAGDNTCKPNVVSYSALLSAWSKSRENDALERGYAILDEMKKLEAAGNHSVSPNAFTYLPIISLISNSEIPRKAHVVWNLLKEMDDRKIDGSIIIMNNILWTCCKSRPEEADEAFEVGTKVFRRIHREKFRPSFHTYTFYFKLLTPEHETELEEALQLCRENGFHVHEKVQPAIAAISRKSNPASPIVHI